MSVGIPTIWPNYKNISPSQISLKFFRGPISLPKQLPFGGQRSRAMMWPEPKFHPRLKMIDDDVFQAGMNLGGFFSWQEQMEQRSVWPWDLLKNPKPTKARYTSLRGDVYIYTRKPGRSPTLKCTPHALSCPFCRDEFCLLDSFFCIFCRIACFCTYLTRTHTQT